MASDCIATQIQDRLLTILLVNHGTGGDLSAAGQVLIGDYPHPEVVSAVPFVAIGPPEIDIEIGSPLNQFTDTMRSPIEGWAPVSSDLARGRIQAAQALADHVVGAIQEDFAADSGTGTLFDLLLNVPAFEGLKIHNGSVRNGAEYGRFTCTLVTVYRRTSGV